MIQLFRCSQGHDWSAGDAPADSSVCPICGLEGVTSIGPQLDNTVPSGDELPPLPRDRAAPSLSHLAALDLPGYEILGELGRGGMGIVYRARQSRLNRLVALKLMQPGIGATGEAIDRFKAEAEAVAALQHPHIVQIYDIIENGGTLVCALEFVAGGSLSDRLAGQPMPPREAVELVATLARAMQHAHDRGIIHRDLKPANILLSGGLVDVAAGTRMSQQPVVPKITDFGLAKRLDRGDGPTRTGAVLGTPCYMAPEQAQGKPGDIGPWTDIYALGAILYECLTGRPPFRDETAMATLLQVVNDPPTPPRRINRQIPRAVEAICLRCLEKVPAKRYPSARALADDLEKALDSWTLLPAELPRPRRGRTYLLAGVTAVLALITAGLIVGPRLGGNGGGDDSRAGGTLSPGTPSVAPAMGWQFTRVVPEGQAEKFDRIAFPTRQVGYAASRSAVYRTEDGGNSWRRLEGSEPPGRIFILHFENDQVGWLGTDRLRHTRDGGQTWTDIAWPGPRSRAITALATNGAWTIAGGSSIEGDLVLARRGAPDQPWQPVEASAGLWGEGGKYRKWVVGSLTPVGDQSAIAVLFSSGEVGGSVLLTDDRGSTWREVLSGVEYDLYRACITAPGAWLVVGEGGNSWRTTDGGKNWSAHPPAADMTVAPGALASAPDGRLGLMTLWQGRIAITRDWQKWEVTQLGDGSFGYSMPSAAVVDSECLYVLAADGRLAALRK
jgi:serine/threonine protein kinase/photosystem II stability/assembly factor-like uncharacterized protein